MPLFLIAAGIVFLVAALRGTLSDNGNQKGLLSLLQGDFVGQNNFIIWIAAIAGIGAVGYIKPFQTAANWMLALVLLSLFLSHSGFFAQFVAAIQTTQNTGSALSQSPLKLQAPQTVSLTGPLQLSGSLSNVLPNVTQGP